MNSNKAVSCLAVTIAFAALGCGAATDSPQGELHVGQMQSRLTAGLQTHAGAFQVSRQTGAAAGTGGIGQANLLSFRVTGGDWLAPDAVAVAPDGTAWYTTSGALIRVAAADDGVTIFDLPSSVEFAPSITPDRRGFLWLAVWSPTPGLARLDPVTNELTVYNLPDPLARPTVVAASPVADEIFVAGGDRPVVGRIDSQGQVFVIASEASRAPVTVATAGLAVTDGGTVYLSDYDRGRIGRVQGGGFRWIDLGGDDQAPSGLAAGANDSIAFVSLGRPRSVGIISADGTVSRHPLDNRGPVSDKSASQIARGLDGAFWFTLPEDARIGRLTADGTLGYLDLASNALPRSLAFDARGRLWVTTVASGMMTRIDFAP